ncbi:MAG: hypothetical protein FWF08_03545 [Oscillospiraceae bacterium]|nr:hypothetical protein [Oscillospiraceae bacterium]
MKKTLSLLLAVMMLSGVFAIGATAAEEDFGDLSFSQVYLNAYGVNVALWAVYSVENYKDIVFTLIDVYEIGSGNSTGAALDVGNKGSTGDYIWFNADFKAGVPTDVRIYLAIDYTVEGEARNLETYKDVTVTMPIDKSEIEYLLSLADKKMEMRYTKESWKAFKDAQKAANEFLNDINRQNYEEYLAVYTGLEDARDNLESSNPGIIDYIFLLIEFILGILAENGLRLF